MNINTFKYVILVVCSLCFVGFVAEKISILGEVDFTSDTSGKVSSPEPYRLEVIGLGKSYTPEKDQKVILQNKADKGGNTSVRNIDQNHLIWKKKGYFQRNRDLGQVFTTAYDFQLDAIVLRTGPDEKAVLAGAPGSKVFIQFFVVTGTPRILNNGTPQGTKAKHGFTTNHRADDFIKGVQYRSIAIARGGTFPDIPVTYKDKDAGQFYYMRWKLTGKPLKFKVGKRYAFMVGFEESGPARGFTLANSNAAGIDAPSGFNGPHDAYPGGWAIRREGNGKPPTMILPDSKQPPNDSSKLKKLFSESLFPSGARRFTISPYSNGYPDVGTYRDYQFALEIHQY